MSDTDPINPAVEESWGEYPVDSSNITMGSVGVSVIAIHGHDDNYYLEARRGGLPLNVVARYGANHTWPQAWTVSNQVDTYIAFGRDSAERLLRLMAQTAPVDRVAAHEEKFAAWPKTLGGRVLPTPAGHPDEVAS